MTERERLAAALKSADWSGVSIGNKALITAAIDALAAQEPAAKVAEDATIKKSFVLLQDPGCVPEKKGAFLTEDHCMEFIREAIACRPLETKITRVRLTWNDDLWVDCGRELVAIDDAIRPRKRKRAAQTHAAQGEKNG